MRTSKIIIGVVAIATALTACSGSGSDAGKVPVASNPSQVKGDITYAIWDVNQRPAMQSVVDAFNKKYPNVKVTISPTTMGQYFTKLKTQGASDNLPDVFWMNAVNFQLFASNDKLAPLDSLIQAKLVDPANYPKALDDLYTLNGKQYGVPKDFDTIALWYNKKLFKQAGVAAPTADWTWQDYRNTAKVLKQKLGPVIDGFYATGDALYNQANFYETIVSNGGFVIKDGKSGYSDPKTIEALQFWSDMVKDGSTPSAAKNAETEGDARFFNGKAAMMWNGNWAVSAGLASAHKDDFTVVPIPKAPNGERKTVIHGLANVMSAKSKNPEAAAAFLAFLGTKDAALIQAKTGAANPAFNGTQGGFVSSAPSYNLQVFIDAATQYSVPYPVSKNTDVWNQLENDMLRPAFGASQPMSVVANEVAAKMDAALAKEK